MSKQSDSARIEKQRMEKVYSEHWMTRLRSFVRRRYHDFGDWEGWFEEAHQNLALKVAGLPHDRDVSDALVFAIFKNELISVKRSRLGYPRPRKWLQEFSQLGQSLFEWMCLQRMGRNAIIDKALESATPQEHAEVNAADAEAFREIVEKLTDQMISKRECDGVRPVTEQFEGEDMPEIAAEQPATVDVAGHEELKVVLSLIFGDSEVPVSMPKAESAVAKIRSALKERELLTDTDLLILRCYYFKGLSQNEIAKLLKQPLQRTVRQREAAIARIREFLEKYGLNREALF